MTPRPAFAALAVTATALLSAPALLAVDSRFDDDPPGDAPVGWLATKTGMWTKADSVTLFDNFRCGPPGARAAQSN